MAAKKEVEVFLNFLFSEESGWVYAPVKTFSGFESKEHFFEWPRQRSELVEHIQAQTDRGDVYIAPALFASRANALVSNVRGSNVVWVDFDGEPPSINELKRAKVPPPNLRIQSSAGHEHWYWKLSQFETDVLSFQSISKALAYAFDNADLSGWDASQVLRPIGSVNHKRDGQIATLVSFREHSNEISDFAKLPTVDKVHFDEAAFKAMGKVQPLLPTVHKYSWNTQELNVLYKPPSANLDGRRGKLLFRLASICAEKGMPDSDIYAIVAGIDAQPQWRKFADRPYKERCYISLIDRVRQENPYRSEADKLLGFERLTFLDHFAEDIKVEFLLDGYLIPQSVNWVLGKSGSGKTNWVHDVARRLVLHQDLMHFKNNTAGTQKIVYFSYEMNKVENALRYEVWKKTYTEGEIRLLQDNFLTFYPGDAPPKFYVLADQARIMAVIEAERPDGIILDSASMSMAPNMNDEESAKSSFEFIKALVKRFQMYVFIVHHPRKDPPGVKSKTHDVDGVMGAQVLINQSTTAININRIYENDQAAILSGEEEDLEQDLVADFSWRKYRIGATPAGFRATLLPDLTFGRPPVAALTAAQPKALPPARKSPQTDILQRLGDENKNSRRKKSDEF